MATLGVDCNLVLDGNGYYIEPGSYGVTRPHAGGPHSAGEGHAESNIDWGPARRSISFIVVAYQAIKDFSGTPTTQTGQQIHDQLIASYQKTNTTIVLHDPHGQDINVRFENLVEHLVDARAQADGELQYAFHVQLREATDQTITLDGNAYWMLPGSYIVTHPHAGGVHSAGGGHSEANMDFGLARRDMGFALLASDAQVALLDATFAKINTTLVFIDPAGTARNVRITGYALELAEIWTDSTRRWYAHVALREATDQNVTLDGNVIWLVPGSYEVLRPRVRTATLNRIVAIGGAGVGERSVDFGPAKREWELLTISTGAGPGTIAALLTTSYEKVNTPVALIDPAGTTWPTVRFDDLKILLAEVRVDGTQSYYCHCQLREA